MPFWYCADGNEIFKGNVGMLNEMLDGMRK